MATISVFLHIIINISLLLQPVHKIPQLDTFCSPVMASSGQKMYPSNTSQDLEQESQPSRRIESKKRKCDIEPWCGCPCARPEEMVLLPDFNRQGLPTQRCRCIRCGQANEYGRRRCSVIILFTFSILMPICNEWNDGGSILERQPRRTSWNDERRERQEKAPSEKRIRFRYTN